MLSERDIPPFSVNFIPLPVWRGDRGGAGR